MYSREEFKAEARRLRAHLSVKHGLELSIGHALEAIAAVHNYPNWDAASASAKGEQPASDIRPYKEVQVIVSDGVATDEVYKQVCNLMRVNPDHFAFLVEETDARSSVDWEKITDIITQCEISFSRSYVTAEYLTPSI
ncbi:MAG: hypothetical protein HYS18_01945 [Burkholderiales bacterium]|nr:hypothetical protein [Burkholderiales bacterium]